MAQSLPPAPSRSPARRLYIAKRRTSLRIVALLCGRMGEFMRVARGHQGRHVAPFGGGRRR